MRAGGPTGGNTPSRSEARRPRRAGTRTALPSGRIPEKGRSKRGVCVFRAVLVGKIPWFRALPDEVYRSGFQVNHGGLSAVAVGRKQLPPSEATPVRCFDLPVVGVSLLSGVIVDQRDGKAVPVSTRPLELHGRDVRLSQVEVVDIARFRALGEGHGRNRKKDRYESAAVVAFRNIGKPPFERPRSGCSESTSHKPTGAGRAQSPHNSSRRLSRPHPVAYNR